MTISRILMTADTIGGVWAYARDLARGLSASGIEIILVAFGKRLDSQQRAELRTVPHLAVYESEYRLEWMENPWDDIERAGHWLLELERTHEPDIVHLNGFCHGALAWNSPTVVVGHSCVNSWWQSVFNQRPPAQYMKYSQRVRQGLHAATAVVAPTRAMLTALQKYYGKLPNPWVIPNGVWLEDYRPGRKEPFVLAAGRLWDRGKNLNNLVEAAGRISWPLYMAGDIASPSGTIPPVEALGQANHIGRAFRVNLMQWMSRASIFAHPARYEPFGLAPLEAAASGCALVLGDIETLREVWGNAAVFIPPDDPQALAETLAILIDNADLRSNFAARALERSRRYHAVYLTQAYLALYRCLREEPPTATQALVVQRSGSASPN